MVRCNKLPLVWTRWTGWTGLEVLTNARARTHTRMAMGPDNASNASNNVSNRLSLAGMIVIARRCPIVDDDTHAEEAAAF